MDLKYFKNEGDGIYSILLHGEIGKQVDGRLIAAEILMLNEMGAKVIKERINTIGGSIVQGYSIVSANLASRAEIHTFNEGVADSTGSWILASGTPGKRGSFDFASVFLHNPTYNGKPIDEIEDEGVKREMKIMTDSIITILANNSNKSKDEIKALMEAAKRLTANNAKSAGIIDFVKTSKNKPVLSENMTAAEMMNVCGEFNNKSEEKIIDNHKIKTMKRVAKFFNISEEATEDAILQEVQNLKTKADTATSDLATEKAESGKKDIEITNLKKEAKEKDAKITDFENKGLETAVDAAIKSGKYKEDKKEELTGLAKSMGIENFNKMVEMQAKPHVDVLKNIDNGSGSDTLKNKSEDEKVKLAKEYQKLAETNPSALKDMEDKKPEEFKTMYAAWNEIDLDDHKEDK